MRDISLKSITLRIAEATATLRLAPETLAQIRHNKIPKGDPLPVAKVAAVQAAKNTSLMIPYCHPLPLEAVECRFVLGRNTIEVKTEVKATYKTGVEMEALAAASAAALTLYDMLKMIDDSMEITNIRLVSKKGGKSDIRPVRKKLRSAAVLIISDSVSAKRSSDASGKIIVEALRREGFSVKIPRTIPDDPVRIKSALMHFADHDQVDLVLTTGGTGLGPRDRTPEATADILDREISGVVEILRSVGQQRTPYSMLSRGKAGMRGKALIINLPGSPKGVTDSLAVLFPALHHAFDIIAGGGHGRRKLRAR